MVVQPTFLYELLWNLLIFVVLIVLDRRFTFGHGRLFATYVAGYCVGRFWVELLRDDTATHIAGIRINSFTSTFVLIGAVVYLILAPKGREDPATLSGSAAELLEPDSIDADDAEAPTVGAAETDAEPAETAVIDTPDVDAEAVAAEVDAAETDSPEVEVAAAEEQHDTQDEADGDSDSEQPDSSEKKPDEE
jgi:hypothetical protein